MVELDKNFQRIDGEDYQVVYAYEGYDVSVFMFEFSNY